ncbi:MAG: AAA family ATPase, partial [Nocardioides sp.]
NLEESRIAEKRSKRDLAWSDAHVRELDAAYVMNTDPARPTPADDVLAHLPHLRLDNTALSPDAVADAVLEWLG